MSGYNLEEAIDIFLTENKRAAVKYISDKTGWPVSASSGAFFDGLAQTIESLREQLAAAEKKVETLEAIADAASALQAAKKRWAFPYKGRAHSEMSRGFDALEQALASRKEAES